MSHMRALIATALLLSLAACGGGGGFDSASDVAKAADCSDASPIAHADQEIMLTDAVHCTVNGHEVMVGWFKNAESRKNYEKVADQFGGGGLAYGDDWVVECADAQADCDAVVRALR